MLAHTVDQRWDPVCLELALSEMEDELGRRAIKNPRPPSQLVTGGFSARYPFISQVLTVELGFYKPVELAILRTLRLSLSSPETSIL